MQRVLQAGIACFRGYACWTFCGGFAASAVKMTVAVAVAVAVMVAAVAVDLLTSRE